MKRRSTIRDWLRRLGYGLLLPALAGLGRLWGQRPPAEPRWVRFHLKDLASGVEVENQWQQWSSDLTGTSNEASHLYTAPFVEIGGIGSIYHPNLLEFEFWTQNNLAYDQHSVDNQAAGWSGSQSNFDYLLRGNANLRILQRKPYRTTLHANRGRSLRTLDFFSRTVVDSTAYGVQSGFQNHLVPFRVSYDHHEETESGLARPTEWTTDLTAFEARNERRDRRGVTDLDYRYTQFSRLNFGVDRDEGDTHQANLTDTEQWGEDDWVRLRSALRYYQTTSRFRDSKDLQWSEDLNLEHRHNLRSHYLTSVGLRTDQGSRNENFTGAASLEHQLYASLTSVAELRGEYFRASGVAGRTTLSRFSPGIREAYSKKLGAKSTLHLGYAFSLSPENREVAGGFLTVLDEPHTLRDGDIALLGHPYVLEGSIVVTDPTGMILYEPNLDYRILRSGSLMEIRRVPGGRIPNGGTVLVDYLAAGQPSGSFTTFQHAARWRLSLWDRLLSLYARLTIDDKTNVGELLLNEFNDVVAGVESEWKWIRVGGEYENYDSNLTPFKTWRFRQEFQWNPSDQTALGLNLSQGISEFPDAGRRLRFFSCIAQARWRPRANLHIRLEGGTRWERGDGVDEQVNTAQLLVDYRLGKLTAELAYQFQDQSYFTDRFGNHFLHFELKRRF
ncbi:MAG: hypothetical protein D6766_02315 [Verrucomicrobia bacterium]|nr:MAG: hypothetical protein D6766_02315 [Verrucomicrobiota bacterium]